MLPVEVTKIDGRNGRENPAVVDNFSRRGLKLILNLDFQFSPGSRIELMCSLPGKKKSSPASAEVVWSKREGSKWELGLNIKKMDPETCSEILDSCYEKWREAKKN